MNQRKSVTNIEGGNGPLEERKAAGRRGRRDRIQSSEPMVKLNELRDLIALLNENGLTEFELEREGFRLHLRRGVEFQADQSTAPNPATAPAEAQPVAPTKASVPTASVSTPTTPSHPGALAQTAASEDQDLHLIESPIVGTFYRARSPNAEPFVKTGSHVEPETVVCIIEAMKLMNEIQAETAGEVVKIYVENGQPVEYGQPLFGIKRS
jgi:acetyl-CoA carboxylase biotin carboxyl carrier protein